MSYGNYLILQDLKDGKNIEWCARKLHAYYPDIPMYRARLLVSHVKKHGEGPNPYWKASRQEILWRKRFNMK